MTDFQKEYDYSKRYKEACTETEKELERLLEEKQRINDMIRNTKIKYETVKKIEYFPPYISQVICKLVNKMEDKSYNVEEISISYHGNNINKTVNFVCLVEDIQKAKLEFMTKFNVEVHPDGTLHSNIDNLSQNFCASFENFIQLFHYDKRNPLFMYQIRFTRNSSPKSITSYYIDAIINDDMYSYIVEFMNMVILQRLYEPNFDITFRKMKELVDVFTEEYKENKIKSKSRSKERI